MIGRQIGTYQVQEEIGQGGMAAVYLAFDEKLNRNVAIKILHAHLMRQPEAIARFHREAMTVASLHHPNIIDIYDYSGRNSPLHYIVTEYVEGETLGRFMALHQKLPCELAACIGRELGLALAHAHEQGVVHRDIKPENVMIRKDGRIKLMDFGIARALEGVGLTMTGSILGSPAFMSPEHVMGRQADFRSDLFSLGSLLFMMATGDYPFTGRNPHEILKKVADGRRPSAQEIDPAVSNAFNRLIDRLHAADPRERPENARAVVEALDAILDEAEIDRPMEEIRNLAGHPERTIVEFTERLKTQLQDRARSVEKKNPTLALQIYNRLLALEPDHPEATRKVGDFIRRSRRFRGLATIGASLVLIAAISAGLMFLSELRHGKGEPLPVDESLALAEQNPDSLPSPDDEAIPPSDSPPPEPDEEFAQREAALESPLGVVPSLARESLDQMRRQQRFLPKNPRGTPQAHMREKEGPNPKNARTDPTAKNAQSRDFEGVLQVVTFPWADIYIDGVRVGSYPIDAAKKYSLKAGTHTIKLVNPGCLPHVETVTVERPGQTVQIRERLKILPARLAIAADPGTMIFIDGEFKGNTPISDPIDVRWEGQDLTKTVLISATRPGYKPFNRKITLSAGKTESLNVVLEKP